MEQSADHSTPMDSLSTSTTSSSDNPNSLLHKFKSAAHKMESNSSSSLSKAKPENSVQFSSSDLSQTSHSKYFNVSLQFIKKENGHLLNEQGIPLFLERCFDIFHCNKVFRNCEGIFRLSGSIVAMTKLKDSIEKDDLLSIDLIDDPHILTGIIKQFFRELNPPLLTFELFKPLSVMIMNNHTCLYHIRSLLLMLPTENYCLLSYLLSNLVKISENENITKMGINNLALVFGPNLGWLDDCSSDEIINSTSMSTNITLNLLKNYADLFTERLSPTTKRMSLGLLSDGRYILIDSLLDSTFYRGTIFGNSKDDLKEVSIEKRLINLVISFLPKEDIFSDDNEVSC